MGEKGKEPLLPLISSRTTHSLRKSSCGYSRYMPSHINSHTTSSLSLETQVEPPRGSQTASSIRGRKYSYDLHEQLTVHHDSRFLAALLLSLFFLPARGDLNAVEQPDEAPCDELKEGKTKVIWDYAVAAIALAVKVQKIASHILLILIRCRFTQMHRDVFPPLKPIFACHFLAVARHKMGLEDLEVCKLG